MKYWLKDGTTSVQIELNSELSTGTKLYIYKSGLIALSKSIVTQECIECVVSGLGDILAPYGSLKSYLNHPQFRMDNGTIPQPKPISFMKELKEL